MIRRVKASRIEITLFEIEIPGAVLLRHQAALQPVGETSDGALKMGELLVEKGAQPVKLRLVAQFLGVISSSNSWVKIL